MTRSPLPRMAVVGATLLCAAIGVRSIQAQDRPQPTVAESIVVEATPAGTWRATYRLSRPTERLEFVRPANFYRARVWTVATPGYGFEFEGGMQYLVARESSAVTDEIVVEFPEYTSQLSAEYELFVRFSDGGRAIYTGHLYARPDGREAINTLELAPLPGEKLVIRGGVHDEPIVWTDEYGDGTYAFYGSTEPLETDVVIAVLDEGLPGWLREEFDAWIPRVFDWYRERLGEPLPWKPLVLYGHQESRDEGYSYGGGTLTGLIQLTVSGDAWTRPSATAREIALGFVAHEVAHLWNGQLTSNRGTDPWIHEGSADALADQLLLEFGVLDEAAIARRQTNALNGCFLRLGGDAIKQSRHSRAPYECGHAMALWTEAAIRRARPDLDLLDFWAALVDEALRHDGIYDTERYLEVVGSFGVSRDVRDRMREAVVGGGGDAVELVVSGLRDAGVPLETGGEPTREYRRELARQAMSHVMSTACSGRYSYNGVESFRTFPIAGCEPFVEEMEIDEIAGAGIPSAGDEIYDRVVEACAAAGLVELGGPEVTREVPCDKPLRPRRPWYSLGTRSN
ncbi:MAG: hypothetical protein R3195_15335 [Gemmatimonadota bacterium]|nr:hypothetical protein [Gemmatimonadota bacterium]